MRYEKISQNLFVKNRNKLYNLLSDNSIALVYSNAQMPRNGDQYFRYRQNSDFFYLTGIEQEKSILLLHKKSEAVTDTYLFIIQPNKLLETWEGKKLTKKEASEFSGVEKILFLPDFDSTFHSLTSEIDDIYFNFPEIPKFKSEIPTADQLAFRKIKDDYPLFNFKRLAPLLIKLRLIKETEEIELIKKACDITYKAFLKILETCEAGIQEFELEAEITKVFLQNGAAGHAYHPIVASGKNSCYLHYESNDSACDSGDLILFDIGAEYANYAADLSRTIPVNGKFTDRQKELYEACLRVFKKARKILKPGTTINKINEQVDRYWEDEHLALGLYSKEDLEESEEKLCKKYFPHGTSHFMGLDVHDVGSKDVVLEPGMVLTCEPGIYIEKEKTGIRIENDILITKDGNEDLMADIPLEVKEIEKLMKRNS